MVIKREKVRVMMIIAPTSSSCSYNNTTESWNECDRSNNAFFLHFTCFSMYLLAMNVKVLVTKPPRDIPEYLYMSMCVYSCAMNDHKNYTGDVDVPLVYN